MDQTLPETITAVAPTWLTQALHASAVALGASVTSVTADVIGAQFGFTGVIARLHLSYHGEAGAAPRTLIAKLPTADRDIASSYRQRQGSDPAARRRLAAQ